MTRALSVTIHSGESGKNIDFLIFTHKK
jgi:hypothetical protein